MPRTQTNTTRAQRSSKQKPIRVPRSAAPVRKLSRRAKQALIAGATVLAAGAIATGAIVMRRGIGRIIMSGVGETALAGRSIGTLGKRLGRSLSREMAEIDLSRFLEYAGLRSRPSLLRRLLPPIGVVAALVAAGGSALFLLVPRLRAAEGGAPVDENDSPIPNSGTLGDSRSIPNSIAGAVDAVREGVSHAAK
jgi:hypothetical protein